MSLLKAHEVLCMAWAMTGTCAHESKMHPGAQVAKCSLTDAIAYHVFCKEHLRMHPGPTNQAIRWFLDRDRATRLAAVQLHQSGYPWGEALQHARDSKTLVLWQCTSLPGGKVAPVAVAADPDKHPDESPAKKRVIDKDGRQIDSSTGKPIAASDLCPDWNSDKGCTAKQKDCPKKRLHRCSARVTGGFCGHGTTVPRNTSRDSSRSREWLPPVEGTMMNVAQGQVAFVLQIRFMHPKFRILCNRVRRLL